MANKARSWVSRACLLVSIEPCWSLPTRRSHTEGRVEPEEKEKNQAALGSIVHFSFVVAGEALGTPRTPTPSTTQTIPQTNLRCRSLRVQSRTARQPAMIRFQVRSCLRDVSFAELEGETKNPYDARVTSEIQYQKQTREDRRLTEARGPRWHEELTGLIFSPSSRALLVSAWTRLDPFLTGQFFFVLILSFLLSPSST